MGKQIDHNSFWVIKQNPITKIGVFPYLGRQISPELEPNKIYQVLRPESELFTEEALASFNALPITIGHALLGPREEGFTPAEEKGIDGTTGASAERKEDKVVNDIKLFSERIKDEVNHGKKELSAGYFCDFVPESGTWNGRHYDYVQKNIRGNHIALVDKGRSGHDVRVMDSAEGVATRQFVCDAMELGKFEPAQDENDKHDPKTGQFAKKGAASTSEQILSSKKEIKEKAINVTNGAKPVAKIKGGEFSGSDIKSRREAAKQFYDKELKGKPFTNEDSGKILEIADGGKSFSETGYDDKINSFMYLPQIIEKSIYLGQEKDAKNRSNVKGFHYFAGKIETNDGEKLVVLSAREDNNGKIYYNHHITKEEMDSVKAGIQPGTGTTSSTDSINNNTEKIKVYFLGENNNQDLSSKNHGNSGLDAATGKEMTMEELKKAIEAIKALFANPEEGDKDAKLAEIISGLKDEPAADEKCATDENVDKRKLIDEIGGILSGKVDDEIIRTVLKKAEEIAYNDSTAETADDEEETEEGEEETEEKEDKKVASLDEMEKALLARLSRKADLVKQLTPIIGAFDSADMTEKEVAAYACKKLNLSAAMDEAPAVVKGYLAGRAKTDVRVTFGAKAKTAAQDEILNNFKEGK